MRSLEKDRGNKEINLEADLLISAEDIAFMEQNHVKSDPDLEAYLYFLEDIMKFCIFELYKLNCSLRDKLRDKK